MTVVRAEVIKHIKGARFGSTYTKIGAIQRRLAWPLCKDDTQICEAFHIFDEWIRKLWYIYTMEYYSAVKKNSFESGLMRCMKLEPIIQSEVSQKDKEYYSILRHIYGI